MVRVGPILPNLFSLNKLWIIVAQRLALGLLTLIAVSLLIFLGVEALPGDLAEAILGQSATPETVEAFRRELRLDLPPHERYFNWLGNMTRGDLGRSLATGREISELIGWRLANTVILAAVAAAVAVPLSVLLGVLAALYRNTWFDKGISIATLGAISLPEYFIGYILIAVFSVQFNLFPSISTVSGEMSFPERIHSIVLPSITLVLVVMAHMMRMTRASIINLMSSPFIEMAQLKGLSRARVIVHHALPNALSPIINVIVINLAYLVVGVLIVEVVFVYPGLGQLLVDSVSKRDLPVVQASCLIFACTYVLLNITADVLAMISNPKLRYPK